MAHFAKLSNNLVEEVIVVSDSDSGGGTLDTEAVGISFCQNHIGDNSSVWKQTSYNQNFRGRYAGIGFTYMTNVQTLGVASTDIFIGNQPYASWGIGKTTAAWIAPLPQPGLTTTQSANGQCYQWDEVAHQADSATPKTVGWALTSK